MIYSTGTMNAVPLLPLRDTVLFPLQLMPLSVSRPQSVAAVQAALDSEDKTLVVACQRSAEVVEPQYSDLFDIGTLAVIKRMQRAGDMIQVIVQGDSRVRLVRPVSTQPCLRVDVNLLPEPSDTGTEIEALFAEVAKLAGRMLDLLQTEMQLPLRAMLDGIDDPLRYVYALASVFSLGTDRELAILAADSRAQALRVIHEWLAHEVQVMELRFQIASQAQTEMTRQQREYFLRQQLEAIQKELGGETPGEAEGIELRRRMDESDLPEHVRSEIEKELSRLERMSPVAADYQVIRTYIDLALEMPWTKTTEDVLDLHRAREILDEDHYDLDDVKDRIVEHLAVMKMNPRAKAPILCFVGPPGVGKTSVGQSIARAIGRKFERMSLGGLHDEAELRGHRRTYIGAMPGRIIQAIRRAGVRNPLLMLDEVDKLGEDYRGDPASALMEILDPEQNRAFHDNYLDIPFDLSSVFFITTANTLDNIPRPLLDRMEVLRLPGYSDEEKRQIARRYLVPRRLSEAGLAPRQLTFPDDTVDYIIRRYTREAGVRELERMLGRIARKITTRLAQQQEAAQQAPGPGKEEPQAAGAEPPPAGAATTVVINDLPELLGPERFLREEARHKLRPGVAAGLAWTEAGGEVLYVEAVLMPKGRGLIMTGQLGRVMRESARTARSYIRSQAGTLGLDPERMRQAAVHIHVPAGAVPKDGPSAGIAMAAALASIYSGCPVRNDTAMSGEVTLSGLILPVGGVKEKVLAAHRAGLHRIVLPSENEKDLRELPRHVRDDCQFVFVDEIEDALLTAIPGLRSPAAAMA